LWLFQLFLKQASAQKADIDGGNPSFLHSGQISEAGSPQFIHERGGLLIFLEDVHL
jgi:hypothetical protein